MRPLSRVTARTLHSDPSGVRIRTAIDMPRNRIIVQLIWGGLLLAAGVGMFFRIPQVMPRVEQIEQFAAIGPFIRFCLYLVGIILIGGGAKKIHANYHRLANSEES